MKFQFTHYNYNVMDLQKSIKFYEEALGLKEVCSTHFGDCSVRPPHPAHSQTVPAD